MSLQNIIEELRCGTGTTAMEYPKYQKAAKEAADLLEQLTASNADIREKHESALIALEDIANMPEYDKDDAHRLRSKAQKYLSNSKINEPGSHQP